MKVVGIENVSALAELIFSKYLDKLEPRQKWCGMPESASDVEKMLTEWFKSDSNVENENNSNIAVICTTWYNSHVNNADFSSSPAKVHRRSCGPLLAIQSEKRARIFWVHEECAAADAKIRRDDDGSWYNVLSESARIKRLTCSLCGLNGASAVCGVKGCAVRMHQPCAQSMRLRAWSQCSRTSSRSVIRQNANAAYLTCWHHRSFFLFDTPKQHRVFSNLEDPVTYVGRVVEKEFVTHGKFLGSVWHYDPCARHYLVRYEDGDEEELSLEELLPLLLDADRNRCVRECVERWTSIKSSIREDTSDLYQIMAAKAETFVGRVETSNCLLAGAIFTEAERLLRVTSEDERCDELIGRFRTIVKSRIIWWKAFMAHLRKLITESDTVGASGAPKVIDRVKRLKAGWTRACDAVIKPSLLSLEKIQ